MFWYAGRSRDTPFALIGSGASITIFLFCIFTTSVEAYQFMDFDMHNSTSPIFKLFAFLFPAYLFFARNMTPFRGGGYDPKLYPICAPWNGQRGPLFARVFAPAFRNGLLGYHDKYNNLLETLNGTDMGGAAAGAPAFPAAGGGAAGVAANAEAVAAHAQRVAKLCSLIRQHITDPDIQEDIDVNANGDGIAAWNIVQGYGNAPATMLSRTTRDL